MTKASDSSFLPGYATHVGRIGALAAALGVGIAIATGTGVGVAHADDTDITKQAAEAGSGADNGSDSEKSTDRQTSRSNDGSYRSRIRAIPGSSAVPQMRFRNSGGTVSSDRSVGTQSVRNLSANRPQSAVNQRRSTNADSPVHVLSPPVNTARRTESTTVKIVDVPERSRLADGRRIDPTAGRRQSAIAGRQTEPITIRSQAPGGQSMIQAPTVSRPASVLERDTTALTVAISPYLAPRRTAPVHPPVALAVLAWIRREIEHTYFNRTPFAREETVAVAVDSQTPTSFDVLGDVIRDDDDVTYSVPERGQRGGPTSGTVAIDRDSGQFTYTPDAGVPVGTQDEFTVTVTDAEAGFHVHGLLGFLRPDRGHTTTVTVTVTVVNSAPVAPDRTAETVVDKPIEIDLLRDFVSDPDGDPLIIRSITVNATPNQGSTTIVPRPDPGDIALTTPNGDIYIPDGEEIGVFTYTPHNVGVDTITYVVSDGNIERTGTITVDVGAATNVTYDVTVGDSVSIDLLRLVTVPGGATPGLDQVKFSDGVNMITITTPSSVSPGVQTNNVFYAFPIATDQSAFTANALNDGVDTIEYIVHQGDSNITGKITIIVSAPPTGAAAL